MDENREINPTNKDAALVCDLKWTGLVRTSKIRDFQSPKMQNESERSYRFNAAEDKASEYIEN